MKSKIIFVICLCFFVVGCVEPYPAFDVQKVEIEQVPSRILDAYLEKYPDSHLLEIETSTFGSRFQGYPMCWRFKFKEKTNETNLESWFPENRNSIERGKKCQKQILQLLV